MKTSDLMKYLLIILLLIIIIHNAHGQTSSNSLLPVSKTDFKLTLKDGIILDCTKFIPNTSNTGGFPAVIFLHGFGGSKNDVIPFAENLAKKDYYTFAFSMRGQGNSTGLSNLISRTEMNDLEQVIEYVRNEQSVNKDKIALMGSSQGGILSFMAACSGVNVQCAVSDLSSPEFASSWIENGSVKITLFWSLNYDSSIVRYSREVKNYRRWILSDRKDKWDSLSNYLPEYRDFLLKVKNLNTPVLFANAWQDKFFNTLGVIKASYLLNAPFKMYFGEIPGHGSDTVESETQFHSQNIEKWLDYWLYGIDNGILNGDRFTYTSSSHPIVFNHWTYTSYSSGSWPPEGVVNKRLYFSPGEKLTAEPNVSPNDTISFLNDVRDKSLTMEEAINSDFTGYSFKTKFNKTFTYFETDPLKSDVQFIGTPSLNLVYSSTADICQFNFQIWEVQPNGEMNFVTRINYTDRYYYHNLIKQKWMNGISYSHVFKKGYRIRIYLTNLDNGPTDSFLGTNPFVLPVLKRARNYIYMSKENPSYIELPVIYR
jgi:predicted acyl esterase